MSIKIYFLLILNIKIILSEIQLSCNNKTRIVPDSKYQCSGLKIDDKNDNHCCLWKFTSPKTNKTVSRCSSISESQYSELDKYISKKRSNGNYSDLTIQCTGDDALYCSNELLDDEKIDDCSHLKTYGEDTFCCKWEYKDAKSNMKKKYCASMKQFEFNNIEEYIKYKNIYADNIYKDLKINCFYQFLKDNFVIQILLLLLL